MPQPHLSFAAVATPGRSGAEWAERARQLEALGFAAVLVPDNRWTASPFPALAAAGAVTTTLRLRTWVLAAPLRSAAAVVREARTLQTLSDGRLEVGLGTGRPGADEDAAALGVAWPGIDERRTVLEEVAAAVRAEVTPAPPICVTGSGPKALAAAGRVADRIGLALGPTSTRAELDRAAALARSLAPAARLSMQIVGVGDRVSAFVEQQGVTAARLAELGAVGLLPGDADELADTLRDWTAATGVDEVVVPGEFAAELGPVIKRLT